MDGGIVLDREVTRILRAATQLVPDPAHRDQRVRHPAPHRRAGGQADRLPGHLGQPVDADRRALRRRPPRTCSRTPAPSCRAPTRRCRPSSATSPASTRSPARSRRSRSRTSSPSATSPPCSSASRWCAASRTRSRTTSSSSAPTAACSPSSSRSSPAASATTVSSSSATTCPGTKAGLTLEEALANLEDLDSTELLDLGGRRPGRRLLHRRRRLDSSVSPLGYRLLTKVPRLPGAIVDRLVDALRQPAEAARRQHRRPHGRRRRRRGPGPARARGPVAPGRVEHPRALRLTRAAASACRRAAPPARRAARARARLVRRRPPAPCRGASRRAPPWGVFVSEVMSQQTPVARVEPVWREWMQRWPTPADLAAESPGEVVRAWGRLGYPRRALRLHEAAVGDRRAARRRGPGHEDALLALPGVGAYTAAAVAAFAFGAHHRGRHQRAPGARPGRRGQGATPRRR